MDKLCETDIRQLVRASIGTPGREGYMVEKTLFVVQQFERRGKKLMAGRSVEYRTSAEAVARAERDAEKFAGVVALTMAVDTDTGEVVEEAKVLARFGEVGREFQEE